MNAGHLFEGIGGITLGFERAGIASAWGVEIDRFCNRVLERRWPYVPRWRDVGDFARGSDLPPSVDVVTGGCPCQDLSVAGRRAGLAGERSGLFFEFVRIVDSLAPTWVLFENVLGLLSSASRASSDIEGDPDDDGADYHGGADFAVLLAELTGFTPEVPPDGWRSAGVCVGPKRAAAWRVLDSQYFGVPQRRKRVFVVCHPRADVAAAVLFEPESGAGDPAPRHQPGEEVAGTLGLGTPGSRGIRSTDLDGHGAYIPTIAQAIRSSQRKQNGSPERSDVTYVAMGVDGSDTAHTVKRDDGYVSEDGTGRQPGFAVAAPITGGGHPNSNIPSRHKEDDANLVVYSKRRRAAHHDDAETWDSSDVAPTVNTFDQGDVRATALVADSITASEGRTYTHEGKHNFRLHNVVGAVRRLTITEIERLQGFPDGWTHLCPAEPYSMTTCECPDGPRVGAIGNAVTVNVAEWIGRRMADADARA